MRINFHGTIVDEPEIRAGRHVWTEKPPAVSCEQVAQMRDAAKAAGKNVVVGMKKMFFPANEKAKELMDAEDFGTTHLVMLQYPLHVPSTDAFFEMFRHAYFEGVWYKKAMHTVGDPAARHPRG